jgi:3-hydroxy-9,10-secoandrosta-1,3,5(10)-triene-9,17-dione monooxygenase
MLQQAVRAEPPVDFDSLLAAATAIGQAAGSRSAEIDAARKVPEDLIEDMRQAGLFRARQPARWGGYDMPPLDHYRLIYAMARGSASAAWVYCVLSGHAWQIAEFPLDAQEEVWGKDAAALASSSYAPVGRATPVDGGFRLSGRFPFSSGCDHAQWGIVGAFAAVDGRPQMLLFMVPMTSMTIIDDWHTLGLLGTGSKSLACKDVFVPAARARPPGLFVGGVAAFSLGTVAAGATRGAVDGFIAETICKPPGRRGRPADSEMIQGAAGMASGEADAAWLLIERAMAETQTYPLAGETLPVWLMARNRADQAAAGRLCVQAVDRLLTTAGGHGVYDSSDLQRRFRDVHTASQHIALNPELAAVDAGMMLLNPDRPWPPIPGGAK